MSLTKELMAALQILSERMANGMSVQTIGRPPDEAEDGGGGQEGKNGNDPGPPAALLENLLLAVASWWVGRHSRAEVLDLMTRHFLPVDIYQAHQELAKVCTELSPGTHKNSQTRTVGEAYAIDL